MKKQWWHNKVAYQIYPRASMTAMGTVSAISAELLKNWTI